MMRFLLLVFLPIALADPISNRCGPPPERKPCKQDEYSCHGGHDMAGCPLPDTCHSNGALGQDNNGNMCLQICPVNCGDEVPCDAGYIDGCKQQNVCSANGKCPPKH